MNTGGEAEAEKEADAGADQEITAEAPVTLLSSAPGTGPGWIRSLIRETDTGV